MKKLLITTATISAIALASCEKSTECCNTSSYCETLNAQDFASNDAYEQAIEDYEQQGFTCN